MKSLYTLSLILSLISAFLVDFPTAANVLLYFVVGLIIVKRVNHDENGRLRKIYALSYISCLMYAMVCFAYMEWHSYTHLLISDSLGYIEELKDVLALNLGLSDTLSSIWLDFDIFKRNTTGYLTYMVFVGYYCKWVGANLYFGVQLFSLFLCSFGAVVVYKLLKQYIDNSQEIQKFAVIICILPMYWQYATFIIRDNLIALGYYYIILLMHKKIDFYVLLKFLGIAFFITSLRIESGYATIMFLPFMFLIHKGNQKRAVMLVVLGFLITVPLFLFIRQNFESLFKVFQDNRENYFEGNDGGTISTLSRIPIVGNFLSLIYGLLQPMPCWARMFNYYMPQLIRPWCYNVMGFPCVVYTAFNTYIMVYFFLYWRKYSFKNIKARTLKIIMIPSLIFMLLQSGIVEPRRIMGVFIVFFAFWTILYREASVSFNKSALRIFTIFFVLLQFLGIFRYM